MSWLTPQAVVRWWRENVWAQLMRRDAGCDLDRTDTLGGDPSPRIKAWVAHTDSLGKTRDPACQLGGFFDYLDHEVNVSQSYYVVNANFLM